MEGRKCEVLGGFVSGFFYIADLVYQSKAGVKLGGMATVTQ